MFRGKEVLIRPHVVPASPSVPCLGTQLEGVAGGPGNRFNKSQHDASKPPYLNIGPGNSNKEGLSVSTVHAEEHPEVTACEIFKPSIVGVKDEKRSFSDVHYFLQTSFNTDMFKHLKSLPLSRKPVCSSPASPGTQLPVPATLTLR